jgi:hypothetical protein
MDFFRFANANLKSIANLVISRKMKPLAAFYPSNTKKSFLGLQSRALLLIFALSGHLGSMLMPTAFKPLSIASV